MLVSDRLVHGLVSMSVRPAALSPHGHLTWMSSPAHAVLTRTVHAAAVRQTAAGGYRKEGAGMGDGPRETGALIDPSTDTWRERFRLARRDRRAARGGHRALRDLSGGGGDPGDRGAGLAVAFRPAPGWSQTSASGQPRGRWRPKVLPRPTSLSTDTRPPCTCATCLTMASPRPVPPRSRLRALSTL